MKWRWGYCWLCPGHYHFLSSNSVQCTHHIVSMILEQSHFRPTFTVTSLSNNKMSTQHGMIYFWTKIHLPPGPFLCLFNAAIVNSSWPHSQGQLYSIECLIRRWLRKAEITKQQECKHIRLRGWGLAVFYLASRPGQIMVLKDIQIASLLQKLRLNGWILSVSGVASERVCLFFNPFITWLGWEVGCTPWSRCHTEACRSAA